MTKQELDRLAINTTRTLSIDAVQEAKSGHPGTPMALAPLVYTLWNWVMRFDPQDPRSCWSLLIVRGGSSTSDRITSDCYEFDQQCFVVLYPDGYKHNWNDCRKNATFPAKVENIDDMGFIRALIDRVKAEHAINPKRVYAFGYSNGGHMAFRLAIEAPSEVAAIAALGAGLPTPDSSSCSQLDETSRAMLVVVLYCDQLQHL